MRGSARRAGGGEALFDWEAEVGTAGNGCSQCDSWDLNGSFTKHKLPPAPEYLGLILCLQTAARIADVCVRVRARAPVRSAYTHAGLPPPSGGISGPRPPPGGQTPAHLPQAPPFLCGPCPVHPTPQPQCRPSTCQPPPRSVPLRTPSPAARLPLRHASPRPPKDPQPASPRTVHAALPCPHLPGSRDFSRVPPQGRRLRCPRAVGLLGGVWVPSPAPAE